MRTTYFLSILAAILIFAACKKKDPCEGVSCQTVDGKTGGECISGACSCNQGYTGSNCQNYVFVGTWVGTTGSKADTIEFTGSGVPTKWKFVNPTNWGLPSANDGCVCSPQIAASIQLNVNGEQISYNSGTLKYTMNGNFKLQGNPDQGYIMWADLTRTGGGLPDLRVTGSYTKK